LRLALLPLPCWPVAVALLACHLRPLRVSAAARLGALARALLQRLETASEPAGLVERLLLLVALAALAQRGLRLVELLAHGVDAVGNVAFHRVDVVLRPSAAHEALGEAHLVAQPVVAHGARRFRELARRSLLVGRCITCRAIERRFQLADLRLERVLLVGQLPRLLRPLGAAVGGHALGAFGDLRLTARDVFGLRAGVLHVALGTLRLAALQLALGVAQPFEGGLCLCGRVGIAACRGAPHRIAASFICRAESSRS
jgi:hypothetical protein